MSTLPQALPRSLDPLRDESIIGYVLRLAHRLGISPARLVEVTGLNASHRTPGTFALSLAVHAAPAARAAFAHATRLSPDETNALFLSAFADRYPAAHPQRGPNRRGSPALIDRWLFTRSTRYCPQCLAAGPGDVGRELGGPWRRTWRLPVVFACTRHRRYLDHHCPACHQPVLHASPPDQLRWRTTALHPTQCRVILRRDGAAQRTACAAHLSADIAPTTPASAAMMNLQWRILRALNYDQPDQISVLGQDAAVRHYFTDLQLLTYLIRVSWPHGRDLVPTADLADELDAELEAHLPDPAQQFRTAKSPRSREHGQIAHPVHKTPPLDARACAALLATADTLLALGSPRDLSTELRRLLAHDDRRPARAAWSRTFLTDRPDCSEGLRQALAPVLQTYVRARRPRRLHAPIRRTPFGPEHIAQFLQQDWYDTHFAHFTGIAQVHLRRGAALHLAQLAAGGSIQDAAAHLGLPYPERAATSTKLLHRWARRLADPHEFDTALHALADQLETTPALIDYHRRRTALRGDWCIDPATWRWLVDQIPPPEWIHGREPQLGDRKRQSASIYVWARVTGSEHLFAPYPLRDQLPADQWKAWRDTDYTFWARFQQPDNTRAHDIALRKLLNTYADRLAAHIDTTATADHTSWSDTLVHFASRSDQIS